MKPEFELGRGIEELIQISITTNFVMENYYGKTNPEFYEQVMLHYEILEKVLPVPTAGQDDPLTDLEYAAAKQAYYTNLQKAKERAISLYLEECQRIVESFKSGFVCQEWYEGQIRTTTDEERTAIIGLMKKIREMEEKYVKGATGIKETQSVQKQKSDIFNHLRYGPAPRNSEQGGYMAHKKDMHHRTYFVSAEELREIFGIPDEGKD